MDDLEAYVAAELAKLREDYIARLPGELAELAKAAAALRGHEEERPVLEDLHHRLHRLAGSGGTFGLNALSAQARALEKTAKAWLGGSMAGLDDDALGAFAHAVAALPATLNTQETRVAGESQEAKPLQGDGQAVQVWLVDDDVTLGQELTRLLQQFGYEVRAFNSLAEVESALQQVQPDVMIMDVMFHEEGLNATEVVSSYPRFQAMRCPILFMSGDDDFHSRVRAARLGAVGFLSKPLDIPKLVERMERIFEDHAAVTYRVLIVDDDQPLAEHYRLVLAGAGMDVKVCNDPEQVVQVVATERPELVLMDMHMPGYNGSELAAVIRQYDEWLALPIVYLSAETDLDEQIKAMGRGADDFITKPISDAQLVAAVRVRAARSRQLSDLMSKDSLTGLLKHARIKEEVEAELLRARRNGKPVSVVMADIDHFKKVNDSYGHAVGDRVIKAMAQLLKQRLRKTDAIGRYGGEEFAVVLPECNAAAARAMMDDIRQRFAALRFIHGSQEFSVTMSAGIACSETCDECGQLLVSADEALYQAKHGGRNQVRLHAQAAH